MKKLTLSKPTWYCPHCVREKLVPANSVKWSEVAWLALSLWPWKCNCCFHRYLRGVIGFSLSQSERSESLPTDAEHPQTQTFPLLQRLRRRRSAIKPHSVP